MACLGAVTAEALSRHEDRGLASARGRLAAAERAGLLRGWRVLHEGPTLYTVTRSGMRAAGVDGLEPGRLSPASARHAIVCCAVAAQLERAFPDDRVLGEPALRRRERELDAPLASIRLCSPCAGGGAQHRPDLVLLPPRPGCGAPVAVEVELTVKAPRRLRAICLGWARARHVAGVVYLVADDVRAPLERAIESIGGAQRIVTISLETFLGEAI
ncbi:MAG: hypothetical protein ACLQBB_15605 [Solirubrobacteraceae bacterium]